jgi:RNA polymerase sigma-70 factor (ECF subfamily)
MAEEVAQEVYIEVWRLAPRYDSDRGSARGWIATIAHRRAIDRVRSEQARRNRDEREGERVVRSFDQVADEVTDRSDCSRLRQAMSGLSDTQAEAVRLAYYEGKTYREVAILLDVPVGTAKTRIRDGLIKLRDEFGVTA